MDVNISNNSNWEKTIEVTVSREELEPEIEKAYREYKKKIQLEGFRKGRVPIGLIKKIFGKEIEASVVEDKLPDILTEIQTENKLKPISPVKIEKYSYNETEGLKFTAFLQVVPEIEIQNYKGLSLEKEVYQVGDEDVARALDDLRDQHAIIANVDQQAQLGHQIIADFQRLDSTGVPIVGEKYENRLLQLRKNDSETENELTDQLIGVRTGDIRQVKLTFKDSENQQQVDKYSVMIKEVKEKKLPELDDEFAKDVGDFENLDELKAKLHKDLENKFEREYEQIFSEKMIDELVKSNQVELPEPMISNYLDLFIERLKENSKENIDEQELRERYRSDTIRQLKWIMIKDKICEIEGIKIIDSEIDDFIEKLAKSSGKNNLEIRNFYRKKENRDQLRDELLEKKVIQFLAAHANVKEMKITRKDIIKEPKIIM